MRSTVLSLWLTACTLVGTTVTGMADVPSEMSIQGRLTNPAGVPVPAGLRLFTFKIYDTPTGGTEIWPVGPGETQSLSSDANGLWNAAVGAILPLTDVVFQGPVRWLEVTIEDGVNPPEVLPRIGLRTHPYTFRAATSQHADSLGNSTLSDLTDQFVDIAGDAMTGPLAHNWIQKNQGTGIAVHNPNDGWFVTFNDYLGTWGVSADVSGDNSNFNVGVSGAAKGNNNLFDANYGLLGYANGSGSTNIGVQGVTGMSGVANYSGLFTQGDFMVGSTQSPGTGGVVLPVDAIDDNEILDEPGVATGYEPGPVTLSSSIQDVVTVSISIPDGGYIEVHAEVGQLALFNTTSANTAWYQIDETLAPSIDLNRAVNVGANAFTSTAAVWYAPTVSQVYYKPAAGTYTFRLAATKTGSGIAYSYCNRIRALYIPRAYGPVITPMASRDLSSFDEVTKVTRSSPSPGQTVREVYTVDLRELELKAKRAELAAERARRELVEAQLLSEHGALQTSIARTPEPRR